MVVKYNKKINVKPTIVKRLRKKCYNKEKQNKVNVSSKLNAKQLTAKNRRILQSLGYQLIL